eukprot:SAG31_NODE_2909_length_4921_cov_6.411240_2_plen_253_part_00
MSSGFDVRKVRRIKFFTIAVKIIISVDSKMDVPYEQKFDDTSKQTCQVVIVKGKGARIYPKGCRIRTVVEEGKQNKRFTKAGRLKRSINVIGREYSMRLGSIDGNFPDHIIPFDATYDTGAQGGLYAGSEQVADGLVPDWRTRPIGPDTRAGRVGGVGGRVATITVPDVSFYVYPYLSKKYSGGDIRERYLVTSDVDIPLRGDVDTAAYVTPRQLPEGTPFTLIGTEVIRQLPFHVKFVVRSQNPDNPIVLE